MTKPSVFQAGMASLLGETPTTMALAFRTLREAFGGITGRGRSSSGVKTPFAAKFVAGYLATDKPTYIAHGAAIFGALPLAKAELKWGNDEAPFPLDALGLDRAHTFEQAIAALIDAAGDGSLSDYIHVTILVNLGRAHIEFPKWYARYSTAEQERRDQVIAGRILSGDNLDAILDERGQPEASTNSLLNFAGAVEVVRTVDHRFLRGVARLLAVED